MGLRVIHTGHPDLAAAIAGRIQVWPGLQAGITRFLRHGIEFPLQIAGGRVKGLQETGAVQVIARSHQQVISDHYRCHGRKVLLLQWRNFHVPVFFPGKDIQ